MVRHSSANRVGLALVLSATTFATLAAQQPVDGDTVAIEIAPVTVTVLRTPFVMDEVPYAVSVNTREAIQLGKPGVSVEEALRLIPGVQVENRFNYALGERVTIRGFGARAQFNVRGVRVMVDGIPATLPDGQSSMTHVDVKSLGRVEVMRGPAASLYGNTAGGVIQMEMQRPPPFAVSQSLGVIGGSHGFLRLQSGTGGQVGRVGYQLNLARVETDGYREHSSGRNLHLNGRLGFDTPRDQIRLTVSAGDSDALNPGSLSTALQEENRFQAFTGNITNQTGKTVREGLVGANWIRSIDPGSIEFSAYVASRDVVNPIPGVIIDFSRTGGGVRSLFRSDQFGPFGVQVAAGVEADRQRDDRLNFANAAGEKGELRLDQLETVDNFGLFSQVSVRPVEGLTLLGGLRYDWFDFDAQDRFLADGDDSGNRRMDAISPSVGATYAFSDDLHLYGNIGMTFETPTTTELANQPDGTGGFNADLDPQQATSYEIGSRVRLGQMVALQLAVYHADVDNALIPFQTDGGRDFFRNAGTAKHQGVELGATVAPVAGLSLQTAYSYTNAEFVDYTDRFGNFRGGNKVPGVAPHRLEAALTYSPQPDAWYAAVETRHVSRLAVNDSNQDFSPAYTITEVRGGVDGFQVGSIVLDPFVGISNVFDRKYNTAVTVNAFGGRFYESGPGRSFYLGGNVRVDRR
jgi:iron complex outermembrane recepter protein